MADITFNCPYCEERIGFPEGLADTKGECPSCQCEVLIPKAELKPTPPPTFPVPSSEVLGNRQPNTAPHFVAAKCPSCGGDLQVPDNRDQVKCMYCGGTVIIRQAIQLAGSGVNIPNLMELAKAAAKSNNPKEAHDYYTKVLEYEPGNTIAWMGKGEAAGWMSTLRDVKTTEMIVCFNHAIKHAPDSQKVAVQRKCADSLNNVALACFSIANKHLNQFVQVENVWPDYLKQCGLLISALEAAHTYDPANKVIIENIILLCVNNVKGIKYSPDGLNPLFFSQKLSVSPQYAAILKAKINEYTVRMYRLDPSFKQPKI